MDLRFASIVAGAFFLEMAGYVAFPYLSLRLRDGYGFTEQAIGTLFLVAIWLRPVWSILGGLLSERIKPFFIFVTACLAEGLCFILLAIPASAKVAGAAIIIGNIGFSLWSPNLFGLVYKWYGTERAATKVSLLTGSLNAGAAFGCIIGGIVSVFSVQPIFLGAGLLYLVCIPILGFTLFQESAGRNPGSVVPGLGVQFKIGSLLVVLLITFGFWSSYSQFNYFFALFASDWLRHNAVTGFAFGGVAVGVALFSVVLSRLKKLEEKLVPLALVSGLFFAGSWCLLTVSTVVVVIPYVLSIAFGEACFSVLIAQLWARLQPSREHLMQSVNFAVRNMAMGVGSFVGGVFYHSPREVPALMSWAVENSLLIGVALLGLVIAVVDRRVRNWV